MCTGARSTPKALILRFALLATGLRTYFEHFGALRCLVLGAGALRRKALVTYERCEDAE